MILVLDLAHGKFSHEPLPDLFAERSASEPISKQMLKLLPAPLTVICFLFVFCRTSVSAIAVPYTLKNTAGQYRSFADENRQ